LKMRLLEMLDEGDDFGTILILSDRKNMENLLKSETAFNYPCEFVILIKKQTLNLWLKAKSQIIRLASAIIKEIYC
jgi:hypothetical protein